jgi:hypothetical protein
MSLLEKRYEDIQANELAEFKNLPVKLRLEFHYCAWVSLALFDSEEHKHIVLDVDAVLGNLTYNGELHSNIKDFEAVLKASNDFNTLIDEWRSREMQIRLEEVRVQKVISTHPDIKAILQVLIVDSYMKAELNMLTTRLQQEAKKVSEKVEANV